MLKLTVEMGIKAELEKQKKPLWVLGFWAAGPEVRGRLSV